MSTVRIGVEVSERQRVGNLGQPALRQIPILIGRDSRLFLEDDVEVRGIFESALESDLLACEGGVGQQLLAPVYFQLQQVLCRGKSRILAEQPAEPRVTHEDACGDLLV